MYRKTISFCIALVTAVAILISNGQTVFGKTHEEMQLEAFAKDNEYIAADEAIAEFGEQADEKPVLPTVFPFEPTHKYGRVDEEGRLRLHYAIER
ncbi:hypothetical protein [Alteribacter natronophilus]|uniref:hypothetical protein n=1 Tax=Alteribacter natronophilus TaxID=2583810 RepID=UPI00110EFBA3|nr:hypothetical protein [Alteribacter natronophilus]TMW70924.1 hypothetical protein FGB90_13185 [Alteribacter natronophilus]